MWFQKKYLLPLKIHSVSGHSWFICKLFLCSIARYRFSPNTLSLISVQTLLWCLILSHGFTYHNMIMTTKFTSPAQHSLELQT